MTTALETSSHSKNWLRTQLVRRTRRVLARIGLQNKLLLAFMGLLILGGGVSGWVYVSESRARLNDIMGEQARQLALALALASKPSMQAENIPELRHIGKDLLKTRNILFVAFFDAGFHSVAEARRNSDFTASELESLNRATHELMQTHRYTSETLGDYIEVCAPVLGVPPAAQQPADGAIKSEDAAKAEAALKASGGERILGYVSVGISLVHEQTQINRVNYITVLIGASVVGLSLPVAYGLVHRIFYPIRQLVAATNKIAAGDLGTRVAIDRPDVIGDLARSFNEMVNTVKRQQDDLAAANHKLEKANARLESANHDLEDKVHQRTAQLESANAQLESANAQLATANRRLSSEIAEKEDFLRAVSHDLNAPLRNISGMASMLLLKHREQFDEDVIHRLERIQKNVDVETDLIAELLELSRIKSRRLNLEDVDVAALVHDMSGLFENDLKTLDIDLIVDNTLPTLHCERARVRQVFQNLIDNAIKYMGDGIASATGIASPAREIHIGCTIRRTEAEFYVRDTGIGIDHEDQDKVFFIFRRGKSPAVQKVAGKGVGLASVKSIIETYNGTIWVESAPGRGSTFRFTINGRFVKNAMRRVEQFAVA